MDSFRNLKYIGYCLSNLPPVGVPNTFEDFVNYCKFQLCIANNVLMKDPVWKSYDEEDIISEYYAHVMTKDPEYAKDFLAQANGVTVDVNDWLDEMIAKNQDELETQADGLEESVEYTPPVIGD